MDIYEEGRAAYATYLSGVASLSQVEKSSYDRKDYSTQDQLWPDYLDFIEEWDHQFEERLTQTRRQYLYCLATRNQRIVCFDHFHELSTRHSDTPGLIVIGSADTYIDMESCLWRTIVASEQLIFSHEETRDAFRLTTTEHEYLKRLVRLSLIVNDGLPGTKVDFNTFKEQWWNNPTRENALSMLSTSKPQTRVHDIIRQMRAQFPAPEPKFLRQHELRAWDSKEVDVIWSSESVEKDHGLHTLLDGAQDGILIYQIINRIRRYAGKENELHPDRLLTAIRTCEFCKMRKQRRKPSFPGVYYAPPGNGKTTALRKEVFVGIDTDWLLKNSTFRYMIAPFLEIDIPVITNQYHLVMNSGAKMFGLFNKNHLRKDEAGNEFTPVEEILAAKQAIGSDLCLLLDQQFMDTGLTHLYRLSFLYNLTQQAFSHQPHPFNLKEKYVKYTDTRFILSYLERLVLDPKTVFKRKRVRMKRNHSV